MQVSVTVLVDDLFFSCCKEGRIAELAAGLAQRALRGDQMRSGTGVEQPGSGVLHVDGG